MSDNNLINAINRAAEEAEQAAERARLEATLRENNFVYVATMNRLKALKSETKKLDIAVEMANTQKNCLTHELNVSLPKVEQNIIEMDIRVSKQRYAELETKSNNLKTEGEESIVKINSIFDETLSAYERAKASKESLLNNVAIAEQEFNTAIADKNEVLKAAEALLEESVENEKKLKADCEELDSEIESHNNEIRLIQSQSVTDDNQNLIEDVQKIQNDIQSVNEELNRLNELETSAKEQELSLNQLQVDFKAQENIRQELADKKRLMETEAEAARCEVVKIAADVWQLGKDMDIDSIQSLPFNEETFMCNYNENCAKLQEAIHQGIINLSEEKASLMQQLRHLDEELKASTEKHYLIDTYKKLQDEITEKEIHLSHLNARIANEKAALSEAHKIAIEKASAEIAERNSELAKIQLEDEKALSEFENKKQDVVSKYERMNKNQITLTNMAKKLEILKGHFMKKFLVARSQENPKKVFPPKQNE